MIEKVIEEALPLVVPSEEDVARAKEAELELRKRLDEVLKKYPQLEYRFLGSYARGTWLKESLEMDVFILFPEDTPKEELERIGLEIGKAVVDEYELRYAAHPYVHGIVKGVEVDVVPCYKLKSAEKIKSAVDRTPFHHEWLKDRIKGKENDVRLLKKFLKVAGIYGAEYKVRGFSGYLCELLVVFYGSFLDVVKNATKWTRNTVIDVPNGKVYRKKGGFFVVDPVDPKRNVAANLSLDNLARFVERCREFLENPSKDFFVEKEPALPDDDAIAKEIEARGTGLYAVVFSRPDVVDDNLYPQLEKACRKIDEFLRRENFMPLRSSHYANDEFCCLIFETQVRELARIRRHEGPPFEEEEHVKRFLKKERKFRPFIEGGKYWVYVERKLWKAEDAIADLIKREWKSMGKNVGEKLKEGFDLLIGKDVLKIGNDDFKKFLVDFLCIAV
jgi:tRNA nucleotidyltransferase (CCA-adding enzyme)